MKPIKVKVPTYKQVRKGFKEIIKYQTDDGQEFLTAKEAETHEKALEYIKRMGQILKVDFSNFDFMPSEQRWYHIATSDDLMFIYDKLTSDGYCDFYLNAQAVKHNEIPDDLHVGDWVTSIYEDGGDYRSTNSLYTLEFVKKEINTFLEKFNV